MTTMVEPDQLKELQAFVEDIRAELRMGYGEGHGVRDMFRIIRARNRIYLKLTTNEEARLAGRPDAEYTSPHPNGSYPSALDAVAAPDNWQPIDTAPKDKTWVLVWYGDTETHGIASWADTFWIDLDGDSYGPPTHWQLLPNEPAALSEGREGEKG